MNRTIAAYCTRQLPLLVVACIALVTASGCASTTINSANERPPINTGVPFFYYHDLQEAADWYVNKLGLERVTNKDWVVIVALNDGSQLGLVNASGGSLAPIEEKGALLSIEVDDLEGWYEAIKDIEGINMIHGIEVGAQGMIEEFRMLDPGGYIIEFFRWKLVPDERID